jgi:predicted amino acid dehydrogenase
MATPVLDFGSFTTAEKANLLAVAKAEYLRRIVTGRVTQGSSAAQSYGIDLMQIGDLIRLINGLTVDLGLQTVETRVRPVFNQGPAIGPTNPIGFI